MHLLFQHCNYTLFYLVPYTLLHWQPILGAEWQSYTLFELHVSDQPHWKKTGREDNTINIFVSLILHIPVIETRDLSVVKAELFLKNYYFLFCTMTYF